MRLNTTALLTSILVIMLLLAGCSKSRLVGSWTNTRTGSKMEFNDNKTGIIHQRSQSTLPIDLHFTWKMINKQEFTVSVAVPGYPDPVPGRGKLDGNTLVLENDTFTRTN